MQNRLLKLLQEQEMAYKEKQKQVAAFTEDPLSLFTHLQQEAHLIPSVLSNIDEKFLLEYQEWQYPLVHQALLDTFRLDGFEIRWDTSTFPSPFYLLSNGYPVAFLDPYSRSFTVTPSESVTETLATYQKTQKKRLDVWQEYQMARIRYTNPFVDEDDSVTNTLRIAATKKRRQKETMAEINRLEAAHDQLVEEIQRLDLQLEGHNREHNTLLYDLDKLYSQMQHRLNLSYRDGHSEAFADLYVTISEWEQEAEEVVSLQQKKSMETEQF